MTWIALDSGFGGSRANGFYITFPGNAAPLLKGFCGAFSLKKRPLAPQRPAPAGAVSRVKFLTNFVVYKDVEIREK